MFSRCLYVAHLICSGKVSVRKQLVVRVQQLPSCIMSPTQESTNELPRPTGVCWLREEHRERLLTRCWFFKHVCLLWTSNYRIAEKVGWTKTNVNVCFSLVCQCVVWIFMHFLPTSANVILCPFLARLVDPGSLESEGLKRDLCHFSIKHVTCHSRHVEGRKRRSCVCSSIAYCLM